MKSRMNQDRLRSTLFYKSTVFIGVCAVALAACGDNDQAAEAPDNGEATSDEGVDDDASGEEEVEIDSSENGIGEHSFTLASGIGESHPLHRGSATWFAEEVEAQSDGNIVFEVFPEGQLGGLTESLAMLREGVADAALLISVYHPEELPLNQAWQLPRQISPEETMHALWQTMHEGLIADELREQGCVPLAGVASPAYDLMTSGIEPTGPDALEGMIVRVPDSTTEQALTALGASTTEMVSSEMYEAMQRGTIDGNIIYPSSAMPWSLDEVTDYMTQGAEFYKTVGLNLCIADRVWQELNDAERQLLYDVGREATVVTQRWMIEDNDEAIAAFIDAGVEIFEWSEEDAEVVRQAAADIPANWASDVESQGYPGTEALALIDEAIAQALASDDVWDLPDLGPLD